VDILAAYFNHPTCMDMLYRSIENMYMCHWDHKPVGSTETQISADFGAFIDRLHVFSEAKSLDTWRAETQRILVRALQQLCSCTWSMQFL